MGGKGGKKRKGGGLAVPRFGAGGLRTPSPTPSASGSVAGGGVASAVSRHDAAKVPRLRVAESVVDEVVAELVEGVTGISCDPPVADGTRLFVLPVSEVTLTDRGEKKAGWLVSQVESGSIGLDEALWLMFEWCRKEMLVVSGREAAYAAGGDEVLLEVGALRVKVMGLEAELAVGGEREAALAAERDWALLEVGGL